MEADRLVRIGGALHPLLQHRQLGDSPQCRLESTKPTAMQVEKEVTKERNKTKIKNAKKATQQTKPTKNMTAKEGEWSTEVVTISRRPRGTHFVMTIG